MREAVADGRLDAVWGATSADKARELYDEWAARYDAENLAKGFQLPFMGAAAFAAHARGFEGPILDAACGTGLVGASLATLGFGPLEGCDLSPEMLAVAKSRGVYAALSTRNLAALGHAEGAFAGFVCIGAFGPGHAPPASLRELARVIRPGGVGVFSLREDTFVEQGFEAELAAMAQAGVWRELARTAPFRAYLLEEPDLFARIVAVERTAG